MSGPYLYAGRYNVARTSLLEQIAHPARIGVRCSLPGWLQRMEVTVKASSRYDAYDRYSNHLGQGLALYDSYADGPIVDGWIYEVVPDGRHVTYIVGGGWKRLTDVYETDDPGAVTTDAYLKAALSAHAPAIANDQSNIAATGTNMTAAWRVPIEGAVIQNIVDEVLRWGTSADEVLDFWLQSQAFSGEALQKPIAYLQPRSSGDAIDWLLRRRDISGLSLSRNIWNLTNSVTIYYRQATTLSADALVSTTLSADALVSTTLSSAVNAVTTLSSGASAGATAITVNSISGFNDNDEIEIELDSGTRQRVTINGAPSGSTINIDSALTHAATSGNSVTTLSRQIAVSSASGLSTGDELGIELDTNNWHFGVIEKISGTTITIDREFRQQATSGNEVIRVANTITVSSITGFSDGDEISIELDDDSPFHSTVWGAPSGSTIRLRDRLKQQASSGNGVTNVAYNITVDSITGFSDGDEIEIELDSDQGTFRSTIWGNPSGSTIRLQDGLKQQASSGNRVRRTTTTATAAGLSSASQSAYWLRHLREVHEDLEQTAAAQYRDALLNNYKNPAQRSSFSVGSRWVHDGNGAQWPIWRMLKAPGYVRITDLYPAGGTATLDAEQAFFVAAMDYDHSSRQLTITPDAVGGQMRLDVVLQRLGAQIGQMIERG